jgi:hypothetical protein
MMFSRRSSQTIFAGDFYLPNHHLHFTLYHKIIVVTGQCLGFRIVKKSGKRHVIWEVKSADCIVVQKLGSTFQYVLHYRSISCELIGLLNQKYQQMQVWESLLPEVDEGKCTRLREEDVAAFYFHYLAEDLLGVKSNPCF